ncbi:uncharacterized protein FIBRA_05072 [Fibroporia radiculosa]|uniref:AMP-dependent synthetase/ligase domain-containing protein n=1 Tax=Fibroporia radiculosa TaxID=599839 RepID=J4HWW7_9APHY|nr:uncharacterized protein FIBRA_05072 [Fibroporia radiculosa]CCM02957.1 predicted protein [Fibroporia radiculosa]
MSQIHEFGGSLPAIPDDVTVAQFMFDCHHPLRQELDKPGAWLIEDATGRELVREEIRARTDALANSLSARWQIRDDDVVCIFSPNHVDYPSAIWAIHRLGAIVTTANPSYTVDELVYQLKITRATLLIVHPWVYPIARAAALDVGITLDRIILIESGTHDAEAKHPNVQELIEEGAGRPKSFVECKLKPGEAKTKLAFLSMSSGTTGLPKANETAVMATHYALVANVIQTAAFFSSDARPLTQQPVRPGFVTLAVLPFFHAYGLVYIMHSLIFYGLTLVVVPKFDFTGMLRSIEQYRINYICAVPPMVALLCKHPDVEKYDLSSVNTVASGAAPLTAELTNRLTARLPHVLVGQGYGITEAFVLVSMSRTDDSETPGASGMLAPGIVARVLKEDGSLAQRGEPGQLIISSPALALGYLGNAQADGWLYTGDEVIINEKAEVIIIDRIKELLKVKGFQVAPAELEGFLLDHPDVADACVVSIQDEYNGDLPLAYVVPSASAQARIEKDSAEAGRIKMTLIKYVAEGKAHYKQLTAGVELVDVIPKNPSGKLLRRVLRDRAREAAKQGKLSLIPKPRL